MSVKFYEKSIEFCELGEMIKMCPGKRHAWYKSKFGPVKKPIQSKKDIRSNPIFRYTILEKIINFFKNLFK